MTTAIGQFDLKVDSADMVLSCYVCTTATLRMYDYSVSCMTLSRPAHPSAKKITYCS